MTSVRWLVSAAISSAVFLGCGGESTGAPDASGNPPETPDGGPVMPGGPRIFFTDLQSGPNGGGEGGNGAFVTLYGAGFGATRGVGKVTFGGGEVAAYRSWSDQAIVVQLGPAASTGAVVVTTEAGASGAVSFAVRPGNIHFVAAGGDDSGSGGLASPWRTLARAVSGSAPGDIIYVRDGYAVEVHDGTGWHAAFHIEDAPGAPGQPRALVAYPGATASIGNPARTSVGGDDLEYGLRTSGSCDHWVIAGLRLRGAVSALEVSGCNEWRVVANDISCPIGDGPTGCAAFSMAEHVAFLGNEVHSTSKDLPARPSKQYHAVYFTTESNFIDVGWNRIRDNGTCHAIQFHSSPNGIRDGVNQHDLAVHDNWIRGDACSGINFATVDASPGVVAAWNNVIMDVGEGPEPSDGESGSAAIYVPGYTNAGPDGDGEIFVVNNTFFNCGGRGTPAAGAIFRDSYSPGLTLRLDNNIVVQPDGAPYLAPASSGAGLIAGARNLFFGSGAAPDFLTETVADDPRFVDPPNRDLHLRVGSPAIDVGLPARAPVDHDGVPRPAGAIDLGAYEYVL